MRLSFPTREKREKVIYMVAIDRKEEMHPSVKKTFVSLGWRSSDTGFQTGLLSSSLPDPPFSEHHTQVQVIGPSWPTSAQLTVKILPKHQSPASRVGPPGSCLFPPWSGVLPSISLPCLHEIHSTHHILPEVTAPCV